MARNSQKAKRKTGGPTAAMMGASYDLDPEARLDMDGLRDREAPSKATDAVKLARKWADGNWFIETALLMQKAFLNHGLELRPASGKASPAWNKWMAANEATVRRYIAEVWVEWLMTDNVVTYWRGKSAKSALGQTSPKLLSAEDCIYSDKLGLESLQVKLGMSQQELKAAGITDPATLQRYSRGVVKLEEAYGEYFLVVTRGRRGHGFTMPRMRRVFRVASQCESMEVSESLLAYASRLVLRVHKIGFEVKSAASVLKQSEFLWKKVRADKIQEFYKNRQGFAEVVQQFDHDIEYVTVDPKMFNGEKWDTIVNRLVWWAGPIGFLLAGKTENPNLFKLFAAQAAEERSNVRGYLEQVIMAGWNPPGGVKLSWSNRCFVDGRLAWDMAKGLMTQGALSLTTALEEGMFDPETEGDRKAAEAAGDAKRFLPLFDPSHGDRPAAAGRPLTTDH